MVKVEVGDMTEVIIPEDAKYTVWLNEHDEEVRKYTGKWIAIKSGIGIISAGESEEVYKEFKKKYPGEIPFIYHVPRVDEGDYIL